MKKFLSLVLVGLITGLAFGQNMTVRIKAKGDDLRKVISEMFEQTGQQYVIETSARQSLYMSLDGVTLEYAMEAISEVADVKFEKVQGVWRVRTKKPLAPVIVTSSRTAAQKFVESPAPVKKVDYLLKKVNTKLERTSIRTVFVKFAEQSGVKIEVAKDIPEYKIDAFMYNTSLKFALDRICKAASLKYDLSTDGKTVRIRKA